MAYRQSLHRHLCLGALCLTTKRHQHCRTTDSRIEHLAQATLRYNIIIFQIIQHLLAECCTLNLAVEWVALANCSESNLGVVLCTCRVDKLTLQVGNLLALVEHTHTLCIGNICHMRNLDILLTAEGNHSLYILLFNYYGHTLLRLRNRQLGSVQSVIFHRHTIEVDIQAIGQLANSHRNTSCAKVVRLLDQASNIATTEQVLNLALLRGISLLYLRAALLQRSGSVLLR